MSKKDITIFNNEEAAKAFSDERISPQHIDEQFYNAILGEPYLPKDEIRTINVLVHGRIQQWTAYPAYNKDPDTLTVKNHHDYASDVSLVFNVKTRGLVDFRKNHFFGEAKWVD